MEIGWKLIKHQIAQAFKKISTSSAYFITLNEFESKKVVIIGARPAGLTAVFESSKDDRYETIFFEGIKQFNTTIS
jgi:ribulose 1,5-bisphosphate synthetase/thiazole synthase